MAQMGKNNKNVNNYIITCSGGKKWKCAQVQTGRSSMATETARWHKPWTLNFGPVNKNIMRSTLPANERKKQKWNVATPRIFFFFYKNVIFHFPDTRTVCWYGPHAPALLLISFAVVCGSRPSPETPEVPPRTWSLCDDLLVFDLRQSSREFLVLDDQRSGKTRPH